MTRATVHVLATVVGIGLAVHFGFSGTWWVFVAWYVATFVGVHVLMVPFMTVSHLVSRRLERWVRSIIEEEMIRFDLQNYESQLRRVFPGRADRPDA